MKARKERRERIGEKRQDEDWALVELAKGGDQEAFGEIFVAHAPAVRRLLISVVGPGDDLDDLVQDVFVQAHRSLPGFRQEARLATWLHRLTVNVALSHLRRLRRRSLPTDPVTLERCQQEGGVDVHDRAVARERMRRLFAILDTLTPRRRIAFSLFAIAGRSIAEAAEMVGVSAVTMKSRIWFARREVVKKARQDAYLEPLLQEMSR